MKRIWVKTFAVLFCVMLVFSLSGCGSDLVRKVNIGDTKEQVAGAEKKAGDPYVMDSGAYVYAGLEFMDMTGTVVYSFDTSGLVNNILFIADEGYLGIDAYNAAVDAMVKEYGDAVYVNAGTDPISGSKVTTMQWESKDASVYILLVWTTDESLSLYFVQNTAAASN